MTRLILLFIAFGVGTAIGQPIVNDVTGDLDDGAGITIIGEGFGSGGPNVIVFDDFEGGRDGDYIATGSGSAAYGGWDLKAGRSKYSNDASLSGTLAYEADQAIDWFNYIQANFPANTRDTYVSYWVHYPLGGAHPGGSNWKVVWLQGASTGDDDLTIPTHYVSDYTMCGRNDSGPDQYYPGAPDWDPGEWMHFAAYVKGGENNDGQFKMWYLSEGKTLDQTANNLSSTTFLPGGYVEKVRINGYASRTDNCLVYFDDVYVACGPNAQARIEIGDKRNYLDCTKIATSVPTTWGSTNIAAMLKPGAFATGEEAFLFVTDSSGRTSTGFDVTIGETRTALPDQQDPTLAIVSSGIPPFDSHLPDGGVHGRIEGTAGDNVGIARITWVNSQGGSGRAAGSTSWVIDDIVIQEGVNNIAITAYDLSGNTVSQEITIVGDWPGQPVKP